MAERRQHDAHDYDLLREGWHALRLRERHQPGKSHAHAGYRARFEDMNKQINLKGNQVQLFEKSYHFV